jgi:tRNA-splicing ligase RtcB
MKVIQNGGLPIKIWTDSVEPAAMEQLVNVSRLPFIYKWVASMPDVHMGKGAAIGSVIATKGAVVPNLVGVDIGCGMMATKLNLTASDLPDSLNQLRLAIELKIPVGNNSHKEFQKTNLDVKDLTAYNNLSENTLKRSYTQIGTLGGGNHFIEICLDNNQDVWIMLHSGSRNIGKEVAGVHINKAKQLMKDMFIKLDDPELAYLAQSSPEYLNYINDVTWCQTFAAQNRQHMLNSTLKTIQDFFPNKDVKSLGNVISCHHNYISIENHYGENVLVTRKGAVSAKKDEWGIIPGSMGTKSYIVQGKGNKESFCSCSHGAGRNMSRTEAKKLFTIDDLKKQTAGVECNIKDSVIDEIPSAYKDIDKVMEDQKDLVEIKYTLKQIMCIKG